MRRSSLLMLAAAIALGLIAVFLARFVLKPDPRQVVADTGVVTVPAVVASEPIAFGEKLDPAKLKVVRWPADGLPQGSFQRVPDAVADNTVALRAIAANELVVASALSGKENRLSSSRLLGPNMRAVAVPVGEANGVAGFIVPGDRVDVYLTRDPGETGLPYTDQVIQGARVLAVGQDNNVGKDKPEVTRSATIEVTPQQAQKIALAQSIGTLSLSLRNILDDTRQPLQTVQIYDLNDGTVTRILPRPKPAAEAPPAPAAAAPAAPVRPRLMDIYRGAQASDADRAN